MEVSVTCPNSVRFSNQNSGLSTNYIHAVGTSPLFFPNEVGRPPTAQSGLHPPRSLGSSQIVPPSPREGVAVKNIKSTLTVLSACLSF